MQAVSSAKAVRGQQEKARCRPSVPGARAVKTVGTGEGGGLLMPRTAATAASMSAALALDTPLGEVASSTMGREMPAAAAGAGAGAGTPAWS